MRGAWCGVWMGRFCGVADMVCDTPFHGKRILNARRACRVCVRGAQLHSPTVRVSAESLRPAVGWVQKAAAVMLLLVRVLLCMVTKHASLGAPMRSCPEPCRA